MNPSSILHVAMASILALMTLPASAETFAGPSIGVELATEEFGPYEGHITTVVGGWDFAVSPEWRFGFGLRWAVSDIDERRIQTLGANVQDSRVSIENRRGAMARLGRTLGRQWMVYAELGYEQYDVDALRILRAPVCAPPSGCEISRLDGSFDESMTSIGVGVEWAATAHTRLRGAFSRGDSDAFGRNRFSVAVAWQF